ncbi:MAG: hypothetical protein HZA03_05510 [Nitrospinae bacterium]|nr:hypothetical protein [Nitrospinota bacterium]
MSTKGGAMPTIVDATIQGKLIHPIIPNVTSSNEGHNRGKQAAGVTKVTFENSQRLEAGKGRPHADPTSTTVKETVGLVRQQGGKVVQGIREQSKGMYVSTTG